MKLKVKNKKVNFLLGILLAVFAVSQSSCVEATVPSICKKIPIEFPGVEAMEWPSGFTPPAPPYPIEVEGSVPYSFEYDLSSIINTSIPNLGGEIDLDIEITSIKLQIESGIEDLNNLRVLTVQISGVGSKNKDLKPMQIIDYFNESYKSGNPQDKKTEVSFELAVDSSDFIKYLRSGTLKYDLSLDGTVPTDPWKLSLEVCMDLNVSGQVGF